MERKQKKSKIFRCKRISFNVILLLFNKISEFYIEKFIEVSFKFVCATISVAVYSYFLLFLFTFFAIFESLNCFHFLVDAILLFIFIFVFISLSTYFYFISFDSDKVYNNNLFNIQFTKYITKVFFFILQQSKASIARSNQNKNHEMTGIVHKR